VMGLHFVHRSKRQKGEAIVGVRTLIHVYSNSNHCYGKLGHQCHLQAGGTVPKQAGKARGFAFIYFLTK
jgi:hypothetical protein